MSNVVEIVVKGTDKSGTATLTKVAKDTDKVTKSTDGAKRSTSAWKTAAAGLAGAGLAKFLVSSVKGWQDHQRVMRQSQAVIKSTGGAAGVTAKDMEKLSDKIEKQTGVDGDLVLGSENMLATFTNIRNEVGKGNDVFNQATQTVTDMSVALGEDSKNAAIQLGKALNDPIKGVTALQRVGVTFTDAQKKQIKTMVDTGHAMDAQKVILKELNKEFGGSAAAQETSAQKMQVAFHSLQDSVGQLLTPVLDALATVLTDKVLPAVQSVTDWMGGHKKAVTDFAIAMGSVLVAVGTYKVINKMKDAITGLNVAMKANLFLVVVAGLVALGTWFVITYKHSEDFRNKVNGVLENLSHAWDNSTHAIDNARHAWDNVWHAGKNVVNFFRSAYLDIKIAALNIGIAFVQYVEVPVLNVFSAIVHGAASAFGWVPGIGGKLKRARGDFDDFRRGVDKDLSRMRADLSTAQAQRNANALTGAAKRLHTAMNALRNKTITIETYVQQYILPTALKDRRKERPGRGDAAGGVFHDRHYASGGAATPGYGTTITDENGPEIKRLPNGTMIYPAGQSAGMAAQWGAQQPVVLELRSSGTAVDNFLLELLRKAIRVRGGNVQIVLGR